MDNPRTRLIARIINGLVWIGVWVGILKFTDTWGQWVPMIAEAFIPGMLFGFIHIAFRGHEPVGPGT